MRIGSVTIDGQRKYGKVEGNLLHPLPAGQNPLDLLNADAASALTFDSPVDFNVDGVLDAPLPVTSMRDFITFEQHTAGSLRSVSGTTEVPEAWREAPAFYFTNPHAAIGSGQDVPMPPGSQRLDVELEVGIVIGTDGYNLSVEEAYSHIGGFTIFNDWSARDLQTREMKVGLGPAKGKDTATTLGPVVVTTDELEEFRRGDRWDLEMQWKIGDRVMGSDSLANMAWSFAELIAYASRGTWVRAGDVIGSGTCGGGCLAEYWGWGDTDLEPIQVGDTVSMTVQGIGEVHNTVVVGPEVQAVPRAASIQWSEPPLP